MKSANTNDGDDFVVVSIDLSAAHMRAQTPWSADDKRFFEKNRDRQYRMREEFPGEFPNEDNDGWRPGFVSRVIVRRLSENMRRRMRVWVVAQGAYSNDDEFLGAMFSQAVNGPITSDEFNVWLHKTRYTGPKQ